MRADDPPEVIENPTTATVVEEHTSPSSSSDEQAPADDLEAACRAAGVVDSETLLAVAVMNRRFLAFEKRLALKQQGALVTAVSEAFNAQVSAPTNFHHAVLFMLCDQDDTLKRYAPLLFWLAVTLVAAQIGTTCAINAGTIWPTCSVSDQCMKGTFCDFVSDRCVFCGTAPPLHMHRDVVTGNTFNFPRDPAFVGFNETYVAEVCVDPSLGRFNFGPGYTYREDLDELLFVYTREWCDQCVHAVTGSVDKLVEDDLMAANLAAMGALDVVALFFSGLVVALAIVGELKDILLVSLSMSRHAKKLGKFWLIGITIVCGLRRWAFLPWLLQTVMLLVVYKGADALSICFNTVAALFICEIDNLVYQFGFPEAIRVRIENSRDVLSDLEGARLANIKILHTTLIVFALLMDVWSTTQYGQAPLFIATTVTFWIGGVFEACTRTRDASAVDILRDVAKVTGAWALGIVASLALTAIGMTVGK